MLRRVRVNDVLAILLLVVVIPGLWLATATERISLPGEVTGATIAGWTLIVQYYWRKAPPAP